MDIILYNILIGFGCLIIGYFFGSIPFSIIISKTIYHKDVREYGSHNAGATNMGRTFGKKVGILVFLLDVLKSIIPVWGMWAILTFIPFGGATLLPTSVEVAKNGLAAFDGHLLKYMTYWVTALGVTIGHCFPIFAKFKGGKGASNLFGISVGTGWMFVAIPLIIFVVIMKKTKTMSLSVLVACGLGTLTHITISLLTLLKVLPSIFYYLPGYGPTFTFGLTSSIVILFCYLLVVIRHQANIIRLKKHEESKVNLF